MDPLPATGHVVLLACSALGDEAYAVSIRRVIAEETGSAPPLSSIYAALDRLAAAGILAAFDGQPTAVRGGRGKRCYRLTAAGRKAIRDQHRAILRLSGRALAGARA